MKISIPRLLARCVPLLVAVLASFAANAADNFHFTYRSTGENDLRPVQTFDDGERTYLQMKGSLVPVVFVSAENKSIMLRVNRSGQYLVVPAISKEITLQFANLSAKVIYSGTGRDRTILAPDAVLQDETPAEVTPGSMAQRVKMPVPSYGAVRPLVGDQSAESFIDRDALIPFAKGKADLSRIAAAKILRALAGSGTVAKVVITGRDDQIYSEGLARARAMAIRDRVLAAGVPLERLIMKEGGARDSESNFFTSDIAVTWKSVNQLSVRTVAAGEQVVTDTSKASPAISTWKLRASDANVQKVLQRWASDAGWRVVWNGAPEVAVTGDAELNRNGFVEAAEYLLTQAKSSGYKIKGREYSNKVLVVTAD